jgi:hypothetical protein
MSDNTTPDLRHFSSLALTRWLIWLIRLIGSRSAVVAEPPMLDQLSASHDHVLRGLINEIIDVDWRQHEERCCIDAPLAPMPSGYRLLE